MWETYTANVLQQNGEKVGPTRHSTYLMEQIFSLARHVEHVLFSKAGAEKLSYTWKYKILTPEIQYIEKMYLVRGPFYGRVRKVNLDQRSYHARLNVKPQAFNNIIISKREERNGGIMLYNKWGIQIHFLLIMNL